MLGAVFSTVDAEPVFVESGAEALRRYEEGDIDVVFSEVRLPQIDGLVLTRKLKRKDPDAVVILSTALERKSDLLGAIKLGVFDFLVKPFGAREFAESISRAVAFRQRFTEAASRPERTTPVKPAAGEPEVAELHARLDEREAALNEREAALEASVAEFDALQMEMGTPAETGAPAIDSEELAMREAALEEREALLSERETFLEESENALMERSQSLQEWATELEHRAEGMGAPTEPSRPGSAVDPAQLEEIEARTAALEAREKELEERTSKLLERERRVETNEALVKAREDYLRQSESILFRRREE